MVGGISSLDHPVLDGELIIIVDIIITVLEHPDLIVCSRVILKTNSIVIRVKGQSQIVRFRRGDAIRNTLKKEKGE